MAVSYQSGTPVYKWGACRKTSNGLSRATIPSWSMNNNSRHEKAGLGHRRAGPTNLEMCCGTEADSYLRQIVSCITQLKAQGPSRTCNESKEETSACEVLPAPLSCCRAAFAVVVGSTISSQFKNNFFAEMLSGSE